MIAKIDDGGPAFPQVHETSGMSLLDWFAGQVAAGIAAHSGTAGLSYGPHDIAGRAYQVAQAMVSAKRNLTAGT